MKKDKDKTKAELLTELHFLREQTSSLLSGSDDKWGQLLLNSPLVAISLDKKGKIVFANKYFLEQTGWTQDEVLGRDWFINFIPEHSRDEIQKVFMSIMGRKHDYAFSKHENEILHKNGAHLKIVWTNILSLDAQKRPLEVTCLGVDVTEQRKASETLSRIESRLALAVESTGIGFWDWQIDTGEVYFNENWAEIVGYSLDELSPASIETWLALCHPDDIDISNRLIQEHFAGKSKYYQCEARMKHKLGHWVWVLDRGKVLERDPEGNPLRMTGTHQDITERKQAEQALRDSEKRFEALHNASFGGIVIHNKGLILDCNQGLCDITGYTMDELLGMDGLKLIAEKSREMVMGKILSGFEQPYEAVGVRKNGEEYPVRLQARNIPYKGEEVRVTEFRDITEQKRAEKEQITLRGRLEALWHVSSMVEASYKELCDMVLSEIQEMTESKYSFFGFMDGSENSMSIHSWSREAMTDCIVADKPLHFPINQAGVWAQGIVEHRAVIIDDYEHTKKKRGLPEGHVPIIRLLSVPIMQNGRTVAIAAVANKQSQYTEDDVTQIKAFVTSVLLLLDKRKIEDELKTSEERLSLALDTVNEGVWDWQVDTGKVVLSPVWYTMLGYEPNELPQEFETWERLLHEDDLPDAESTIARALKEAQPFDMVFRMQAKSGEWRWINARGRVVERDATGRALRMLGTHADITDRKIAEQALEDALSRLSFHVNNSPLAVVEWKNGTHISKWSKQAELIFGWSEEEVLGKSWNDFFFVHPEDVAIVAEKTGRLFDGSEPFNLIENRNLCKDGAVVHCQWYNSPVRDDQGNILFILSQVADVSELSRTLKKLASARDAAEAANEAKSEFLANMSHEIRTPLNGIMGMLQLLNSNPNDPEKNEYIELALHSSRRLTQLIGDILDLSRVEAGKMTIASKTFDLSEILDATVQLFEAATSEKKLNFSIEIDPAIPLKLKGDPTRLRQIFDNLVGNAIKFTNEGQIFLAAFPLSPHTDDQYWVQFSVSDTGIGIPDDSLGELFEPFTQVSQGLTKEHQGAGLGLSICKQLIELMGGSIAVESIQGEGTTMHFSIPFELAESSSNLDFSDLPERESEKLFSILLAEDDRVSQLSTQRILEQLGHKVEVVGDGRRAIEAIAAGNFDLVLMDVQMPEMDGVEATNCIRAGGVGKDKANIPIIALTAYAMDGDKEKFMGAGMDDYLAKPVERNDLERVLASVVG